MKSDRIETVRAVDGRIAVYAFGGRRFLWTGERGLPLVLELHGSGLTAEAQVRTSGLYRTASARGFALAAPEATIPLRLFPDAAPGFAWNVPGVPLVDGSPSDHGPDDLAFITDLVTVLAPSELYLVGFSGGARLASQLALAPVAFAAVAGLRHAPMQCRVLAFHGDADAINPYRGGAGPRWDASVEATIAAFGPALVHHTIAGGHHVWPGTTDPDHLRLFGPTSALDASALIWEFFTR